MQSKSVVLQDEINKLDYQIQNGVTDEGDKANDAQLNLMEITRTEKRKELDAALQEEAQQQERIDAQEAEVESIELPLDFNELLSDGEFKVTKANEMIKEVVKEDRRAQNVIHNVEIARINADWTDRINSDNEIRNVLEEDIKELQRRLEAENEQAKLDAAEIGELTRQLAQMGLEKKEAETTRDNAVKILEETNGLYNAACEKRNNAIRMLEEANGTINKLRGDVERLQSTKSNGLVGNNISQTNRLTELQAEVTREKAARGIERFNKQYGMDIPTLEVPEIQPVNPVLEEEKVAENIPFEIPTTDGGADQTADRDTTQDTLVEQSTEESEVVTRAEFNKRVGQLEIYVQQLNHRAGLLPADEQAVA